MAPDETRKLFEIVHEDEEVLVVNKPAGLVCHPTKTDAWSSLIGRVRLHLGPTITPHLVNRLDRETSGLTVIARGREVAGELGKLWEQGQVEKHYVAIVHGWLEADQGVIDAPLGGDEASRIAIKDCVRPDGAAALTEFTVGRRFKRGTDFSLLRLRPRTGRKHQLRIHLAHIGHPIVGDKLYGGDEDLYLALVEDRLTVEQRARLLLANHALHASEIRFVWRGKPRVWQAEPEAAFKEFLP